MHQNGERRKTRGGEKRFSAPFSRKERGESRSWIPKQFRSSTYLEQAAVHVSEWCGHAPQLPSASEKDRFHAFTPSLPRTYAFLLYQICSLGRLALDVKQSMQRS